MEDKQSFITEARREQIIKAAIEVLKEIGYVNTSLAKIAGKANISTGLISYHFSGKEDLMNNTLMFLVEQEWLFVNKRVALKSKWTDKLIAFIEASLAYQLLNRANSIALIEIVFNARTSDQVPYYLLEDDKEDLKASLLKEILFKGQEAKEFGDFNPQVVSTIVQGAISETMLSPQNKFNNEEYGLELIKGVLKIVK
ncbi:TetR/AcrR family transcriptional regulator [Desulfotomaculum sp. 1211_IL3151]|uniref:TetR/AcrR family transcriptional regulator n=1 Tax=Desulfotomaculum sp. 1211_IL3151 TaxID=3084055 RepID=UPI002FD925DC